MDISNKFDDPIFVELLTCVGVVTSELDMPYFVVGATARDLVLRYGFDIHPGRATKDIDLGFSVASWNEYERLKGALEATGVFKSEGKHQTMYFREHTKVDLVPFGGIAGTNKKLLWQPGEDTELNLLGFDEAYRNSIKVKISADPLIEIKIASAAGLVLLKLFAWDDRKPMTKDAIDLGILIKSYLQIGNQERLFQEHEDLLNQEDFDYEVAGAHLLGRDLAQICEKDTRKRVLNILERELRSEGDLPLVVQSAGSSPKIDRTLEFWEAIRYDLTKWIRH